MDSDLKSVPAAGNSYAVMGTNERPDPPHPIDDVHEFFPVRQVSMRNEVVVPAREEIAVRAR